MVMMTWDDGSPWPGMPGHDLPGAPVYPSHGLPGGPMYPSHGLPGGPPVYPSHGLPGAPAYPSHGLPGGAYPSQPIYLPVWPFDPTKPVDPDKPTPAPLPIEPGARFILKCTVAFGLILVPDAEPKA